MCLLQKITEELQEAKDLSVVLETEYVKLSDEHEMTKDEIQTDKQLMIDTKDSIEHLKRNYQNLLREKLELVALNNQLQLKVIFLIKCKINMIKVNSTV